MPRRAATIGAGTAAAAVIAAANAGSSAADLAALGKRWDESLQEKANAGINIGHKKNGFSKKVLNRWALFREAGKSEEKYKDTAADEAFFSKFGYASCATMVRARTNDNVCEQNLESKGGSARARAPNTRRT